MKYLLTLLFFFSFLELMASKPSSFLILDAESNEPLAYTSVIVLERSETIVSDSAGVFTLELEGLSHNDTIQFIHLGYETLKLTVGELRHMTHIYMRPADEKLNEVVVFYESLTINEILELVVRNYESNRCFSPSKQRMFFHKYQRVPFPDKNQIKLKKSSFSQINKDSLNALLRKLPSEFVEYQDVFLTFYSSESKHKLVPETGFFLEEGSQQALFEDFETNLSGLFEDFENSIADKDTYYKFRTGILGLKVGNKENSPAWEMYKSDSINYIVPTNMMKYEILMFLSDYATLESKNWEFINKSNKYNYILEDVVPVNGESAYQISFFPRKQALFEGTMFISTKTYAVLQLDFSFAAGKQSEKFQLMGVGHAMNFKKARVVFEKGECGYYLKYIGAYENEWASLDRSISISKKQKRFLVDKKLEEIKLDIEVAVDIDSFWEILIFDREGISNEEFENIQQPSSVRLKKEYRNIEQITNNRSAITPLKELKKYQIK
ncbi:MAG: carboxypeptidase-like regulatory domain-containing protein [Cytophagaceae bacterium]